MISDARDLEDGALLEAAICIVGAGPAGITAALELAKSSSLKILLLESGGRDYDDEIQELNDGPILGDPYPPLVDSRLRFLGGASNHWAGNCMRLTPVDFEKRDWMPETVWPITYDEILPYYDLAAPYVEIQEDRPFDFDYWMKKLGGKPIQWTEGIFENVVSCPSPPTAFGYVYEDALAAATNLTVMLHANVLEIETTENAADVTALRVSSLDGPNFRVRAKSYVLAQGGIEIPRLLLLSDSVAQTGLGNQYDQVGRYFADHFSIRPALWLWPNIPEEQLRFYSDYTYFDTGGFWAVAGASDELRRREQVGGFMFHLMQTSIGPGRVSTETLARSLRHGELPSYLSSEVVNIFTDLDDAADAIFTRVSGGKHLFERDWIAPWLNFESSPNADSRVKLVEDRDSFGQRKVGLDVTMTEQDMHTVRRAVSLLIGEIGRLGYGRVWTDVLREDYEWPTIGYWEGHSYLGEGKHACSTTRMSESPRKGVVDKNCRVHGMSNLYIAGSSVFSTSSYAQPTFSIVAFSIRLADHLKKVHA
ncbi:GMC oxidoreductase [Tropicimonas isoalkanivorans]|uniref:Choline dehydrogenase n=1 Tax=Tropicimonas isoalkanivorans TaxID=441112 RepID=A0A1I1JR21_9RHOB|nr:GMC family oxidoreductase [Tropicimonas isoalkanivorans]SFC50651.1 Choline dehydrogenase [Tropicimonas isoalkanivorans]